MKSLITALWERSVTKKKLDPINPEPDLSMRFEPGEPRERGDGRYVLTSDTSLCFEGGENGKRGDFSVYLAGNWRFELSVNSTTGECREISGFMSKLTAKQAVLEVPEAEKRKLICKSDTLRAQSVGCYCPYPANSVLFDQRRRILCLGNPEGDGEAVEFADRTVAVLKEGRLACVYLRLDTIEDSAEGGDNLLNCIVLV